MPTLTRTSQGLETPQATLARARGITDPAVPLTDTRAQSPTGFTVDIPNAIPQASLIEGGTIADVQARRDQLEGQQLATQQFDTDFDQLLGRVQAPLQATPFQDPERFIYLE